MDLVGLRLQQGKYHGDYQHNSLVHITIESNLFRLIKLSMKIVYMMIHKKENLNDKKSYTYLKK